MSVFAKIKGSRKAWVAIAMFLTVVLQALGLDIAEETVMKIITIGGTFLIGQGIADHGAGGGSQGNGG